MPPRKKKIEAGTVGLAASESLSSSPPEPVAALARTVTADGGAVLSVYREPFAGQWVIFAALPIDKVSPTPYQRELSKTHADRLAAVIPKVGLFLDPVIATRHEDGYWTPNGMHRLQALRQLGAKAIVALVVPDPRVAYRILALNTEKAHNLKDKALEVIRMARGLAATPDTQKRPESEWAFEFEEPAYLTLGLCYEENARFAGGAYQPVIKRCEEFSDQPIGKSLQAREKRRDLLLALDVVVNEVVAALKEAGLKSAYLKPFVIARCNPLRFVKAPKPGQKAPKAEFEATIKKMTESAKKIDASKVRPQDLAAMGGAPPTSETPPPDPSRDPGGFGGEAPVVKIGYPRAMESAGLFEHTAGYEQGEVSGNVRLGKFESQYEELFAEVIEDGVITLEERAKLDKAADALGLDRRRLRMLEEALQAAYLTRHQVTVREVPEEEPRSLMPLEPATDQRTLALQRRVVFLESRIVDLERELEDARSNMAVEVDFSDMEAAPAPRTGEQEDPVELYRRVRHDPRDLESLHGLYRAHVKAGDGDRAYCTAHALAFLGAATPEETATYQAHKPEGLIRPSSSITSEGWKRLLFHPDEEILTGEILAVVVSAVLLGRVAALRHQKALPTLDPARRQDPRTSTVQAVRCFSWAASILGMSAPPIYADPAYPGLVEMVPGVPPSSRLGKAALSGRSPAELSFVAAQHLAWYREERFVRLLLPAITDLEDIFLAALTIGNPGLPLNADVKRRVAPIAKAIEPILEPVQVDRLRGHFLRFIEEGGRTNLQRWANAAELTSTRAGLLLSDDLAAAQRMLELERPAETKERVDDLIVFLTGDRCSKLRKQIGIAVA